MEERRKNLGKIVKKQRLAVALTLQDVTDQTGVSPSHLARIEKGERYPSATIVRKIAGPLGFEEKELLTLAGYLSPEPGMMGEKEPVYIRKGLDPHIAQVLSQEPVEVQRAIIDIFEIIKKLAGEKKKRKSRK